MVVTPNSPNCVLPTLTHCTPTSLDTTAGTDPAGQCVCVCVSSLNISIPSDRTRSWCVSETLSRLLLTITWLYPKNTYATASRCTQDTWTSVSYSGSLPTGISTANASDPAANTPATTCIATVGHHKYYNQHCC